jgi:hypothetical protein
MQYFEVNSDEDLIDKTYYKAHMSRYEKAREKDLKNCKHEKWSKTCQVCKRVITSETTDWEHIELHQLQEDYKKLELILVQYIYG